MIPAMSNPIVFGARTMVSILDFARDTSRLKEKRGARMAGALPGFSLGGGSRPWLSFKSWTQSEEKNAKSNEKSGKVRNVAEILKAFG